MHDFPSSIFLIQKWSWKWLQQQRTSPLWPLNAWPSARHWPARARNLPSLSTSAPPSASPWTPGGRYQRSNHLEKGRAPQQREEMQGEGKPFWKRKLNLLFLPWCLQVNSNAPNVTHFSKVVKSWRFTLMTCMHLLNWKLLKRSVHILQLLISAWRQFLERAGRSRLHLNWWIHLLLVHWKSSSVTFVERLSLAKLWKVLWDTTCSWLIIRASTFMNEIMYPEGQSSW